MLELPSPPLSLYRRYFETADLQAVSELRQEVQNLDPEHCSDAVILPLYAALPPDQQVWLQTLSDLKRACCGKLQLETWCSSSQMCLKRGNYCCTITGMRFILCRPYACVVWCVETECN